MRALLIERVFKILFSTLTISLSARLLTPSVFGELSYSISVAALASIPLLMGLSHLLKVELDHGISAQTLVAMLERVRNPIYMLSLFLWAYLFISGSSRTLLLAAIATYMLSADIYEVLLLKLGQSRYLAATSFRLQAFDSIVKVIILILTRNVLCFLFADFLIRGLKILLFKRKSIQTLSSLSTTTHIVDDNRQSGICYPQLLRKSVTLVISGLAAIAYLRSDQIMISHLLGDSANGYYAAAASISEAFNFVPQVIMASLSVAAFLPPPTLFNQKKLSQIKIILITSGFSLFLGLLIFSRHIVDILFGQAYQPTVPILMLLSPIPILWSLSIYQSALMMHLRKANHDALRNILAAIVNIALNLVLIPLLGLHGAALATVLSLVFLTLYPCLFLPGWLSVPRNLTQI